MASREYCTSVGSELRLISEKFHKLSTKIDHISTGEKQRMFHQIEDLHILMTEIDDRVRDLTNSCSLADEALFEEEVLVSIPSTRSTVNRSSGVYFDYEFGG